MPHGLELKDSALYNRFSNEKVDDIVKGMDARFPIEAHECPWVRVGCIYASITITGKESWLPLLRLLYQHGWRTFIIYTGRHGSFVNMVHFGKAYGILDHSHYTEDQEISKMAYEELPGIRIKLIDTSEWQRDHTTTLQRDTKSSRRELLAQKGVTKVAVIYAWCHSLFTFCEAKILDVNVNKDIANMMRELPKNKELLKGRGFNVDISVNQQLGSVSPEVYLDEMASKGLIFRNADGKYTLPPAYVPNPGNPGVNMKNPNWDRLMTYYAIAMALAQVIESRNAAAYAEVRAKTIAQICSEYWLWAPA